MTKQDKLLIFQGEMRSLLLASGEIGLDKLEEFFEFMDSIALTAESKALTYIEAVKILVNAGINKAQLQANLQKINEVFLTNIDVEKESNIIAEIHKIRRLSYDGVGDEIIYLEENESEITCIDLTRIRMILNYYIDKNNSEKIDVYVEKLKVAAVANATLIECMDWDGGSDV